MAAVRNQTASVQSVLGESQRRLLLEVLRANLRAKNASACGVPPSDQQASAIQTLTSQPTNLRSDLCGVASALVGAGGLGPSLTQKLVRLTAGAERSTQAAAAPRDSVSWPTQASSVAARNTPAEGDGVNTARAGVAEGGETDQTAAEGISMPNSVEDMRTERTSPDEGGGQQGLSIALFAKLAECLPKDQGRLHFLTWADGSCYCGHINAGSLDGVGVYRYTDNSIYCGQWVRDHLQGHGAFITPSGFLYRGGFEADKQHGAGVFVVPNGRTFFGTFRRGRLHGLSCCVSASGSSKPLLGEWREGEFQRAYPLHSRVADFYMRAAESLDLLGGCWNPLPIPVPDSSVLGPLKGETAAQLSSLRDQQLSAVSVLEALRTELPKSLLQVAAASVKDEEALLSSQADAHSSARLACSGKPIVKKRKASLLRPQGGRDSRETVTSSKARCAAQESVCNGGSAPPQRATTTKAQLLRWESEARKLPRIPHLNYNRVLGRWYARVRDPASGRRIWKGYTCAVHGFYQARDMAIDRLRQFSQLVSPLGSGEPDTAAAAEEMRAPLASEAAALQPPNEQVESESCEGGPPEAAASLATCTNSEAPLPKRREVAAEMVSLVCPASDSASCSLETAASEGGAADPPSAAALGDISGCEKSVAEENEDDAAPAAVGLQAGPQRLELNTTGCARFSSLTPQAGTASPAAAEGRPKQHLPRSQSSHSFGSEAPGDVCCRPDTVIAQDGESVACSRLTTADCTDSALSRCTPLSI